MEATRREPRFEVGGNCDLDAAREEGVGGGAERPLVEREERDPSARPLARELGEQVEEALVLVRNALRDDEQPLVRTIVTCRDEVARGLLPE